MPGFYFHINHTQTIEKTDYFSSQSNPDVVSFHFISFGARILRNEASASLQWPFGAALYLIAKFQFGLFYIQGRKNLHHWARGIGEHPFASIIRWPVICVYCALWLASNLWIEVQVWAWPTNCKGGIAPAPLPRSHILWRFVGANCRSFPVFSNFTW